jgi:lysophospholipase L1-like esterase
MTAGNGERSRRVCRKLIMPLAVVALWAALPPSGRALAEDAASRPAAAEKVVDSMDDVAAWRNGDKDAMDLAADGEPHEGTAALAIRIKPGKRYLTAIRLFKPDPAWNDYDGLAFWVKGDGSNEVASIALQAGAWGNDWMAPIPLAEANWHRVAIAWADFIPAGARVPALGAAEGLRPADVSLIHLGAFLDWTTQHTSPGFSLSIDDIRLVRGVRSQRPRVPLEKLAALDTAVAKMKAGQPVTILAVGDSITWGINVGGNAAAYPARLEKLLRDHYKNPAIRVINKAIGGSTTSKHRFWLDRDCRGIEADLVTMMFGYNEKPPADHLEADTDAYIANLVAYIEELAGCMKSPPAVMPIAPIPGRKANWNALDAFAAGVRDLCKEHPTLALADANAHFKAVGPEQYPSYMSDEAHPNAKGQQEMAKVLFAAITGSPPAE